MYASVDTNAFSALEGVGAAVGFKLWALTNMF
jgi:hypothetical protein